MSNAEPNFTGGGSVFGWIVAQWRSFLGSKVDALNGYSTNQTLTNPSINGAPIPGSLVTAATLPLSITTGDISIGLAASFAVVSNVLDYANQSANLVLAGPGSGGAAKPAFRALVAADIPSSIGVSTFNGRAGVVVPTGADYSAFMRSYLAGLTLSNDGSTPNTVIDVAPGVANDSTNAITMQIGTFTKSIAGTWVAGSGNDGMGNGLTATLNTWYHVFLIINAGSADVYLDTSITAANAPSSTTAYRRIGSILLNGSAHIVAFVQDGDDFLWVAPPATLSAVARSASAVLTTLQVPPGVKTWAELIYSVVGSSTVNDLFLYSPDTIGSTVSMAFSNGTVNQGGTATVRTNTAQEIYVQSINGDGTLSLSTVGYVDRRGRDN